MTSTLCKGSRNFIILRISIVLQQFVLNLQTLFTTCLWHILLFLKAISAIVIIIKIRGRNGTQTGYHLKLCFRQFHIFHCFSLISFIQQLGKIVLSVVINTCIPAQMIQSHTVNAKLSIIQVQTFSHRFQRCNGNIT